MLMLLIVSLSNSLSSIKAIPVLNVMPLSRYGYHIGFLFTVAAFYVESLHVNTLQVLFCADTANGDRQVAFGADEQQDVCTSGCHWVSGN
jgi:hypothetical protein